MIITEEYLSEIYSEFIKNESGKVADYIPELKKTPSSHFAISFCGVNGERTSIGDFDRLITMQSVSKPFIYGLALEQTGEQEIHLKVGVEPTGEAFNSIIELEEKSHRPFNPMINSGAIAVTSLLKGVDSTEKINLILDFFSRCLGRAVNVDLAVFLSEKKTGDRNRAIGYLLKNFNIIDGNTEEILDLYFQQCSILVSAQDVATLGAILANGGVNPSNSDRIFKKNHVKNILSLMMTCGMYDTSGKWVFEVGLPAKSGVSGFVLAVIPGIGAIAVSSPLLDQYGHSIRGLEVVKRISEDKKLNIFVPS